WRSSPGTETPGAPRDRAPQKARRRVALEGEGPRAARAMKMDRNPPPPDSGPRFLISPPTRRAGILRRRAAAPGHPPGPPWTAGHKAARPADAPAIGRDGTAWPGS